MSRSLHYLIVATLFVPLLGACSTGVQLARDGGGDLGRDLFNGYVKKDVTCYKCHNGDGTGTYKAPALTDVEFVLSDDEIRSTIQEGSGLMPSFGKRLSEEEIDKIVAYLKTLSAKDEVLES